jgi:hypothetical protein
MMKKSLTETVLYHLPTWKVCEKYFQNAADRFPTGINIGLFKENFKRFYKLPKVRQLTDCLYNVAFGDLNFTDLGKTCLPESVRKEIQSCTLKKSIIQAFLVHLFCDKFKDFKVDNTIFEKAILSKEYSIRNKRDRYKSRKKCSCEVQNAIMAN